MLALTREPSRNRTLQRGLDRAAVSVGAVEEARIAQRLDGLDFIDLDAQDSEARRPPAIASTLPCCRFGPGSISIHGGRIFLFLERNSKSGHL